MKDKIVLIDGHSILNRAFYGIPDLTNAEGLHTNAIYGFLNILFKILDEEKASHLTVAFDVKHPTFRHEMYSEYKGHRKPMLDELKQQVPVMKDVLRAMGIRIVEQAGWEADDLLGTIAGRAEKEGLEVSIISGDRDLLQLATEVVKIRIPKTSKGRTEIENYYARDVEEKYQVTPHQFIDLKALMGDASDNIPGVPRIGEKTATKLIVEYGSIENTFAHVEELKPPSIKKTMEENYHLAEMSKVLATIKTDVAIDYDFEEARIGNLFTKEAYEFYVELEFKNMLSKFDGMESKTAPVLEWTVIEEKDKAHKFMEKLAKAEAVSISLCMSEENILPLFADLNSASGLAIGLDGEQIHIIKSSAYGEMKDLAEAFIEGARNVKTIIGFEVKSLLEEIAIPQEKCFDAIVGAYLLNPLKSDHSAYSVANDHLGMYQDDIEEGEKLAAFEAFCGILSYPIIMDKLKETKMDNLYHEIENPLIYTLFDMEKNGIAVRANQLKEYGAKLVGRIEELQASIYELAGEEFNINSPKQMGVILFEKLELPHGKKTKTGYSTSVDVLDKLKGEYPIVSQILEYRQLTKLKSTYADGLANYIGVDGRIHGKFNQTITATGRISSTEPNLQNIPARMELGRLIRKVFVPEEGYVFIDADYSQIELRILAHCSGDEELIKAYNEGADIHRLTASQVFNTPFEEVTDLQRCNAKAVNFGIVYGISAFSLSEDLKVSRKEAQEYIDKYFATYPRIKMFLDQAVSGAKEQGYVETIFGRRRPVPEISSSNFMQRSFGERVAMNAPIQGAAADIMKIAMNNVSKELLSRKLKSRLVLQVHDELMIETHMDEIEEVKSILQDGMESAAKLSVKLEIDMHQGANWYEAK